MKRINGLRSKIIQVAISHQSLKPYKNSILQHRSQSQKEEEDTFFCQTISENKVALNREYNHISLAK
jgi:hypothetical protein